MSDLIHWEGDDFNYDEPEPHDSLNRRSANRTRNAWRRAVAVSRKGHIWIDSSELHNILRTTKENANHLVVTTKEKHKLRAEGKEYISGTRFIQVIDKRIQNASKARKGKYMEYSESIYREIRDSSDVNEIRIMWQEKIDSIINRLKSTRKKKYNLKRDELTGERLSEDHFSHIRGKEVYRDIADKYWNGLVVNRETHNEITREGCINEEDLLDLCDKKGWRMGWYDEFDTKLEDFYS